MVYVDPRSPRLAPGGNLSTGDLHFSMGDGEITAAVEMYGWIDLGLDLIKGGVDRYGIQTPIFKPAQRRLNDQRHLTFHGLSVDDAGRQHILDATLSFRQACRNAINYLERFGYSRSQAYMLACAPIESQISCICNRPNAWMHHRLPTNIFDFDIYASAIEHIQHEPMPVSGEA